MNNKYKYKAYVSYSHRDDKWASWLHRALEAYRVPRNLVGTKTSVGEVPSRTNPVFRDRDDLSSAADLGGIVSQALEDSENLVVICSPQSAASHWVNEEIRQFARFGRKNQIFCVIVDGDPGGVGSQSTCFPPALAEVGLLEPLAADVRQWADGKRLSKLKIVSGMLGLPLDQLRRRDLQKRQRAWALAAVASFALAVVMVVAVTSRITAEQRRDSGQSVVANKLSGLRIMLNVKDDPENLTRLAEWSEQDLDNLIDAASEGGDSLMVHAIELRKHGNNLYNRQELEQASKKFKDSWALLAETYQRDRDNQIAFFELGQAEFYIGLIHMDRGELNKAQVAFMSYAVITWRLIQLQPENAEWVLEMAFALTNLGQLQKDRDPNHPELHLQLMQYALEFNSLALVLDPANEYYQSELGQSHAWLSDALYGVCDLEGALQSRLSNVAEDEKILQQDPENIEKRERLAFALRGASFVQNLLGQLDEAKVSVERSLEIMESILAQNPDSENTTRYIIGLKHRKYILNAKTGDMNQSLRDIERLNEQWQLHLDESFTASYISYLIDWAWIAHERGNLELADKLLNDAMTQSVERLQNFPENRDTENQLMLSAFHFWELKQEMPPARVMSLVPDYRNSQGRMRACSDADMAIRKAIMLGDNIIAAEFTQKLLQTGYREWGFMRVCKAHSLCEG